MIRLSRLPGRKKSRRFPKLTERTQTLNKTMGLLKEFDQKDPLAIGKELYRFASELYPICRSISGNGIRQTLAMIQKRIPLQTFEVPTGTAVFDWTVPKEWNVRDAYIKGPGGKKIVDFQECNLHVLNYSTPVRATMPLSELRPHLFTIPEKPAWIPYRTSYYKEAWGFCLSHNQMLTLEDGEYEVCVDSTLEDGHLTYAECCLPGRSTEEILISCHACHPSLAHDNLSPLAVGIFPESRAWADDLDFIQPVSLAESLRLCTTIVDILEGNRRYRNLNPFCEPQLGRRNLYRSAGGGAIAAEINERLWVLNLSDGEHSLLDIAERSGHSFSLINEAAQTLRESGLLKLVSA